MSPVPGSRQGVSHTDSKCINGPISNMQNVMKLLGLTHFASMILSLARLLTPPTVPVQGEIKVSGWVFKSLKSSYKVRRALLWWHSFLL